MAPSFSDFRHEGRYRPIPLRSGLVGFAWEPPMPRVPDEALECVFYLYPSHASAEAGESMGGCGFFVLVPFERATRNHLYAVTNRHVIAAGNWTFRIRPSGSDTSLIVDTDERQWFVHPDGDDIAILLVDFAAGFSCKGLNVSAFLTPELIREYNIGLGDDAFTIGRFVNHDGKQKNLPVVRFGNLAQMPLEPIRQADGHMQESYLVECRSVAGYSGSPVFVEIPPWSQRPGKETISTKRHGPWLLGINWGHLNDWKPVCDSQGRPVGNPSMQVGLNSGMMGVVPTWKLSEMLSHEEVMTKRRNQENTILGAGPPIASSDATVSKEKAIATAPAPDNPSHKEDFTSLLGRAARAKPGADQT